MHAKGSFDIKMQPQKPDNPQAEAAQLARISLDKRFAGALEAVSQGEMLAAGGGQSSAYVALEKIDGALQGRKGSFFLLHSATMRQGAPQDWSVTVVPDSGTGQLQGLAGKMRIDIVDGKHYYDFEYTLPAP
ncbi:DUF3224 domain-containing protein [Luteimonas gilva]|uniref:DUF3224 domain-containing protein n=1 Tax=Luteimonas gilva TaxID=2572684 RepID=A0A4U5JXS0_9GAMM|nr:DUF3224 domain-containing protein [Luteimonas gilva]TKR33511.1 DUF3224 domain-containing protein [Luteimonas gilva]